MDLPLTIYDLGLWLSFMAILLTITYEIITSSKLVRFIWIDIKLLKKIALIFSMFFIVYIFLNIVRS